MTFLLTNYITVFRSPGVPNTVATECIFSRMYVIELLSAGHGQRWGSFAYARTREGGGLSECVRVCVGAHSCVCVF